MELFGVISFHEHRVFRVLGDVFVKTVYSVSILSGNFCLLDTISELRLSQMRESQAESEENFDRTEKLNEALKMQCVEADTTARMAKRFVANLSHELRTPLNSVIAFNSLLLESGLEPIHQEYVRSSLTSAEALLGIIGQVRILLPLRLFFFPMSLGFQEGFACHRHHNCVEEFFSATWVSDAYCLLAGVGLFEAGAFREPGCGSRGGSLPSLPGLR
jgi:hypothetical protein